MRSLLLLLGFLLLLSSSSKPLTSKSSKASPAPSSKLPWSSKLPSSKLPSSSPAVLNSIKNGLASGLAAGSVKLLLAPFDTIKTLQQHSLRTPGMDPLTICRAASELIKRGGVGELYSGIAVTVVGSMPSVGLYFGVYHYAKQRGAALIKSKSDDRFLSDRALSTLNVMFAAGLGNTVASFSRVPYEVVKQKLQTGAYATTSAAITQM